jgi:hypothetical protein
MKEDVDIIEEKAKCRLHRMLPFKSETLLRLGRAEGDETGSSARNREIVRC